MTCVVRLYTDVYDRNNIRIINFLVLNLHNRVVKNCHKNTSQENIEKKLEFIECSRNKKMKFANVE